MGFDVRDLNMGHCRPTASSVAPGIVTSDVRETTGSNEHNTWLKLTFSYEDKISLLLLRIYFVFSG